MFTRAAITPPKVSRFGWNLERIEHIAGSWPWQILGAIRPVATVWDAGEISFFCPVNNARFRRFPVGHISRNLNTTTSIGEAVKTFGTEFSACYVQEFSAGPGARSAARARRHRQLETRRPRTALRRRSRHQHTPLHLQLSRQTVGRKYSQDSSSSSSARCRSVDSSAKHGPINLGPTFRKKFLVLLDSR